MTLTPEQVAAAISVAETMADIALPLVGLPEWVPVVTAAGELAKKLDTLIQTHAARTAAQLAKEAIDVEVDAAERRSKHPGT